MDENKDLDNKPLNESLEKLDDFTEGDLMIKELERKLAEDRLYDEDDETVITPLTFWDRLKGFIVPIILTILALILTILLLYFFANSRDKGAVKSITNNGPVEEVIIATPTPVVIEDPQPLVCDNTQILNEDGTLCIDPPQPVATPTPVIVSTSTTRNLNVTFSYDKINYDMFPRGIYMTGDQEFSGNYEGFKVNASNRPYANDYFFGRDRNMVSLIGDCTYTVDTAKILVTGYSEGNKSVSGKVVKIISASKPHLVCSQ